MEFIGVGTDIVEVARIKSAVEGNEKFLKRVYTNSEIEYIERKKAKWESYSGRFAGKEAFSKAIGTGVRNFSLKDIEILNDDLGKPKIYLKNELMERYREYSFEISISHSENYATAVVIAFKK